MGHPPSTPLEAPANAPTREAIEAQLAKILRAQRFSGFERLKEFLAFVVTQHLEGNADSLKEFSIGIDVFRKRQDFDPRKDSTVRTAARRLRDELARYYATEGRFDPIVLTLPKGHYVPQFTTGAIDVPPIETEVATPTRPSNYWHFWLAAFLGLALLGGLGAWRMSKGGGVSSPAFPKIPRIGRLLARATSEGASPFRVNTSQVFDRMIVTPDGKKLYLYAPASDSQSVAVLSVEDLQVKRTFRLPFAGRVAVASRDGQRIYFASPQGEVMTIDTRSDRVLNKVIRAGGPVFDLAVTPDEKKLFLAMGTSGLRRISLKNGDSKMLSALACPLNLDMDPQGRHLFVSYQCGGPGGQPGHDALEIYDIKSEQSVAVIKDLPMVGGRPSVAPQGELVLLDGLDACYSPKYDHFGCLTVPSHIFHLLRGCRPQSNRDIPFPFDDRHRRVFPGRDPHVVFGRRTPHLGLGKADGI